VLVAVTLRTTAVALAGMPARLVICTVMVPLSPGVPAGVAPVGTRVSTRRLGGMAVKIEAPAGAAAASGGAGEGGGAIVASPDASSAPAAIAARANVHRFFARMVPMLSWRVCGAPDALGVLVVVDRLRGGMAEGGVDREEQDPAQDGDVRGDQRRG